MKPKASERRHLISMCPIQDRRTVFHQQADLLCHCPLHGQHQQRCNFHQFCCRCGEDSGIHGWGCSTGTTTNRSLRQGACHLENIARSIRETTTTTKLAQLFRAQFAQRAAHYSDQQYASRNAHREILASRQVLGPYVRRANSPGPYVRTLGKKSGHVRTKGKKSGHVCTKDKQPP